MDALDKCASNLMTWEYGRHRPDSHTFVSYMIHFRFSMALSLRVTVILMYLRYNVKTRKDSVFRRKFLRCLYFLRANEQFRNGHNGGFTLCYLYTIYGISDVQIASVAYFHRREA